MTFCVLMHKSIHTHTQSRAHYTLSCECEDYCYISEFVSHDVKQSMLTDLAIFSRRYFLDVIQYPLFSPRSIIISTMLILHCTMCIQT